MPNIDVVLFCPNRRLLTDSWPEVAADILRPEGGVNRFVSDVCQMAKALGEINRYYSKQLPDKYFKVLMKRMAELRKIVGKINKERKLKGKPPLIPWQHLEYLFSGEDRKEMKR